MEARITERGGTSREGHTANRRRGWIGKLRSTTTQRAEGTARLMTAIAMFVVIMGMGGSAAADILVSNLGQGPSAPGPAERLAGQSYAMPFTTGAASTGYILESISINFASGSRTTGAADPVYVYLQEDNGTGNRPNHDSQVAVLTRAGGNFKNPKSGVNKYLTGRANNYCCPKPPHVHLNPRSQYWVYIWAGSSTSAASFVDAPGRRKTQAVQQTGRSETLVWSTRTERRPAPTPQPETHYRSGSREPPTPNRSCRSATPRRPKAPT